jgi:hypothetical protein
MTDSVDDAMRKLIEVLGADVVAAVGRESQWLQRVRKITPLAWVTAILSTLGGGRVQWLADIWRTVQVVSGTTVAYKPFHKQLCKPGFAEFFRLLLERALARFTQPVLVGMAAPLGMFRDIVIHDGSSFALKDVLATCWPGRFTKVSPAAVELHVTMSLLEDNAHTIMLTADSESERGHRPSPEALAGRLFLGDRGFEDKRFFFDVDRAGGSFLVRGTKSIRPTIVEAFTASGRPIAHLRGKRVSWDMLPHEAMDLDIAWEISASVCLRSRLIVLYKKDKRNRDTFVYLHNNLPRHLFSATHVAQLYRLRWQVELFFKECKSHANLHAFDTGKDEIAEGLIWASLLCAVLKRGLTHLAENCARIPLSTSRAASSAKHFLDAILRALSDSKRLTTSLHDAFVFLGRHARRAHPERDRKRGRLAPGFAHLALGSGPRATA